MVSETRIQVLLADDDETSRIALARSLELAGLDVLQASSGDSAQLLLREQTIDVLVTDINMPGNSNLELLRSPAVQNARVATILITGSSTLRTATGAVRLQVYDYLAKPLQVAHLVERIRSANAHNESRLVDDRIIEAAEALLKLTPDRAASPVVHHLENLSKREQEVARLVADGIRPDRISSLLHISPFTARNHLRAIFKKLEVGSQAELLLKLLRG